MGLGRIPINTVPEVALEDQGRLVVKGLEAWAARVANLVATTMEVAAHGSPTTDAARSAATAPNTEVSRCQASNPIGPPVAVMMNLVRWELDSPAGQSLVRAANLVRLLRQDREANGATGIA